MISPSLVEDHDDARRYLDLLLRHPGTKVSGKASVDSTLNMHLTTLRIIRGWHYLSRVLLSLVSVFFAERPATERLETS
jgi:hypothetical protein